VKTNCGRGSALDPAEGAYRVLPHLLAGLKAKAKGSGKGNEKKGRQEEKR